MGKRKRAEARLVRARSSEGETRSEFFHSILLIACDASLQGSLVFACIHPRPTTILPRDHVRPTRAIPKQAARPICSPPTRPPPASLLPTYHPPTAHRRCCPAAENIPLPSPSDQTTTRPGMPIAPQEITLGATLGLPGRLACLLSLIPATARLSSCSGCHFNL